MSARDYLVQIGLVLLSGGAVVGVRELIVRREKPKKKPSARKKKAPTS